MIRIYSADGFIQEFWLRAKDYKYLKDAYESLEKENMWITIHSEFVEIEK